MTTPEWTRAELDYLKANYQNMTSTELATHLPGRTRTAIKARAHMMGLKTDQKYNPVSPKNIENLQLVKSHAERIRKTADDVLNGTPITHACKNNSVSIGSFRSMMETAANKNKSNKPIKVDMAEYLTPEEKLYIDVVGVDPNDIESMPFGLEELWPVALNAVNATPRARKAIYQHYWEGKPVNDIACTMNVSRETLRQDIKKVIRKLRCQFQFFMAHGLEHYMAAMEIKQNWDRKSEEIATKKYQALQEQLQTIAALKELSILENLHRQIEAKIAQAEQDAPTRIQSLQDASPQLLRFLNNNGIEYLSDLKRDINDLISQIRQNQPELEPDLKKFIESHTVAISKTQIIIDPDTPIEYLDLSTRTYNCLHQAGIEKVEQLQDKSIDWLASIKGAGQKTIEEIVKKAASIGIKIE